MISKKVKFRRVERDKYKLYLKKARDFYETMLSAYKKENWNSVGLEAIHCAISAADALMVYAEEMRCASDDHNEAVEFLELYSKNKEIKKHLVQFRAIISKKNLVEYEGRDFSKKEAVEILKRAERFLNWIREQVI